MTNKDQPMTEQHRIIPSPELLNQWKRDWVYYTHNPASHDEVTYIAVKAARWGADQELDAICELVGQQQQPEGDRYFDGFTIESLKLARRPKPPSEKEQALEALDRIDRYAVPQMRSYTFYDELIEDVATIRRALSAIPTDTQ